MEPKRNAYWDNLKAILIFLVVLGHFLLPVSNKGKAVQTVYYWIYLFHMPAFVFVSGVFSKNYVRKDNKECRLIGFLILFVGFTLAVSLEKMVFLHQFSIKPFLYSLFVQSGAPWYMLSMLFWYILIPYVSRIRPILLLPSFIVLALLIGNFDECGDFLVLSRTIVFFPFFLAGFHFDEGIQLSKYPGLRIGGGCFLIFSAAILYFFKPQLSGFLSIIYANSSYLELGFIKGVLMRLAWYIWASCMTISLMCIIPKKGLPFTYIGERTLAIYILHLLIRNVCNYSGLYNYLGSNTVLLAACVLISLIVVFLSSAKPISTFLGKAFKIRLVMKT